MNFTSPEQTLHFIKQNNVIHLDTAGRYPPSCPARSEEGFNIDTKILAQSGGNRGGMRRDAVKTSLNTSLRRVNTLHIHMPDLEAPLKVQAVVLNYLYQQGNLEFPTSNQNYYRNFSVYQDDYSVVTRGMENKLLPILREQRIAYNVIRILTSAFLSGKLTHGPAEGTCVDGDSPIGKAMQNIYNNESLHNALKTLEETTRSFHITTINVALQGDRITRGASSIDRIRSNMKRINKGPLPEEYVKTFEDI
ncbi:NADP-dependent oxidoreductase domain-containing protein [Aspergillus transmontanensis]|uniref:NADP-dependent oxidoreductase domain-containing protein n=1 Tax=Aspergillus transmontanensis TaxID=1034304 RepID=A0A5N6VR09_9EURO|nr:NADP-dependent oxidoreductase domain-containing protein [Aspergillus transmontanensis]